MTSWRGWSGIAREAFAAAMASPIVSIATIIMVAGMCLTVLLTTGRTVGNEQAVLSSIDSAGTRTITVDADASAGLRSDLLDRLASVDGIEWAAAFGPAVDSRNTLIADGTKVAVRLAYGSQFSSLGIPDNTVLPGATAWGPEGALVQLGMPDGAGSITTQDGINYSVAGEISLPPWLSSLSTTMVVPQPDGSRDEVTEVVIIVDRPDLVVPVATTLQSLLAADDPSKVAITTSEQLAKLRAAVQGQLGNFGRGLIALVLVVSGLLVATILTGLVIMRRRDFGRRRALGATRGLIVGLVLVQTLGLAIVGSVMGTSAALCVLVLGSDPLPGLGFTVGIGVLAVATSLAAAAVPAVFASRRDPLRELRVP